MYFTKNLGEILDISKLKEGSYDQYLFDPLYVKERFNKDLVKMIKNNPKACNRFEIVTLYESDIWQINNVNGCETLIKFKEED